MSIFIILYIWYGMLLCIPTSVVKRNRMFVTFGCFFPLWLIQILRHNTVGCDLIGYKESYENIKFSVVSICDVDFSSHYEIGYQLFSNIINLLISDNFNIFLLIVATLVLVPVAYFIYEYSTDIVLSFVIYSSLILYHFSFSGLRQAIAISLTILAISFLFKNNTKMYFLFTLLATSFHVTSIIFFIVYFFHRTSFTRKQMNLCLISILCVLPFLRPLMILIVTFLFGGEKFMSSIIEEVSPSYMLMIVYVIFYIISFKVKDRDLFFRNLSILAIAGQSLGLISNHASRLSYFFIFYFAMLLPAAIQSYKVSPRTKFFMRFCCFASFVAFFFYSNADGYLDVIPYHFYWSL